MMIVTIRPVVFILLFCTLTVADVAAQRILKGAIRDAETGETLPAVALYEASTGEGTISNAAGMYELRLFRLPAVISVRHIGYETLELTIDESTPVNLDLELSPVAYELGELTVSDEDPAYNIMRKVIARKKEMRANVGHYTAEAYSRFMLYSDFDLVQVQEVISDLNWRPGQGTRSYNRARRMRPAHSQPMKFATLQNIPDFYDDTISLLGFDLVGPTHPEALDIYTFTLGGYRQRGEDRVYDVYFAPTSGLATAFIGHVAVLDEAYVIIEAGMRPSPDNVRPAPVTDWDIFLEQQFTSIGDSLWVPADLRIEGSVSFGRIGVSYPPAQYKQVSRLTRYVLNVPTSDSLFESDKQIFNAPNVDQQDYLFRWNPGLIPMTPAEVEEVVSMDPRMTMGRAFRPIGLLANYTAINLEEKEEVPDEPERANLLGGIYSNIRFYYDRVDGFFLGAGKDLEIASPLTLSISGGYGISSKLPAYSAALKYDWGQSNESTYYPNKGFLRAGVDRIRAQQYASLAYSRLANGVTTYVGWEDYFDYYDRTMTFAEAGWRADRLNTEMTLGWSAEKHESVVRVRDNKGWFFGDVQRDNPEIMAEDYNLLHASFTVGAIKPVGFKPAGNGIRILAKHHQESTGIPTFTRYEVQGALTVPTFYRRRSWPNALHLRLMGATYTGTLPRQFMSILDVSRQPIMPFGAFKTLSGLPVKGSNVWAAYWEHDFSTALFEWLGLWGVAQSGIGFIIHGAHGQALSTVEQQRGDLVSRFDERIHHEAGISLTHFFNLPIRVDLTRNLNDGHMAIGIGLVKRLR